MTILERLKAALTFRLDAYQQHVDARSDPMHPVRAKDVICLREMIRSAETASVLKSMMASYLENLKSVTLYERIFGLDFCDLKNGLEKVLNHRDFEMFEIMMCQVQELAHDNILCRKELAELRSLQSSVGGMDLKTLKDKVEQIGHLTSCNRALRCENHFLSKQLAEKQQEVVRLQEALAVAHQNPQRVVEAAPTSPVLRTAGSPVRQVVCSKVAFSDTSIRFFSSSPSR